MTPNRVPWARVWAVIMDRDAFSAATVGRIAMAVLRKVLRGSDM